MDVVDEKTRSQMMAGIQGKNTLPEIKIRKVIHALGYRFRLHRKDLPGTPDLVLPKYNLIIFMHGCFWHRHERCFYASSPATRREFWRIKLDGNYERDLRQQKELQQLGWRVAIIWECGLRHDLEAFPEAIEKIIKSEAKIAQWPLHPPRERD
ncbi:very short patch repair endonuclease [Carnimonas bestiolae]|uniref:very short patch repair endonuclease n=1 Tax=Carnimonas bestiolae TaxID=3402172 RepID=UPI003EDC11E6